MHIQHQERGWHATERLLLSAQNGSTAAPIELFVRIRETIQTLATDTPLIARGISVRTRIDAAYLHLVGSAAPSRTPYATFLAIGATAMRHLLTREAETQLADRRPHRAVPSFQTLGHLLHTGGALKPRHWAILHTLNEALDHLERQQPQMAEVLEGYLFSQMGNDELALAYTRPIHTVQSTLAAGMTWLHRYDAADRFSVGNRQHPSPPQP